MSANLLDLLTQPDTAPRIVGVVVGIVTNNKDPEGMGRVKVRFPWLSGNNESTWARIATTMAGKKRGTYFLPEVEDEVLVAFEHGDIDFPYIIGALWNGKDEPPETNSDGENNTRLIVSRSGHTIRLDDTKGNEKIEIIDASGKNTIVVDTKKHSITINADADISIQSSNGKLKLVAAGIEIKSQAGITVEATQQLDLKANGQMNIRGQLVNIN
jgi:uncharacterized protein involved in type VI secretion and phage assembly